ncbi:MAG: response regulator transcription factor [Vicinamibacterales bacterium]
METQTNVQARSRSTASALEQIPRIYMTNREIQVVQLLVRGQSNAAIAIELGIQIQTVKNLLSGLYAKLGVSTRLQLVLLALRTGFIAS